MKKAFLVIVVLVALFCLGRCTGCITVSNSSSSSGHATNTAAASNTVANYNTKESSFTAQLQVNGFSSDEAKAAYEIVSNVGCGDCEITKVLPNGAMCSIQAKLGGFNMQITSEDNVVFYVEIRDGNGSTVPLYDTDTTAGGYKNYFDYANRKAMAWSLRPGA